MGAWNTMHVFSNEIFYNEVVPKLRGQKGCIKEDYYHFYKRIRPGGVENIPLEELNTIIDASVKFIYKISNDLDASFRYHKEFNAITSYQEQLKYLSNDYFIITRVFLSTIFLNIVQTFSLM